jgi:signal transduction histidine kinase
MAVLDGDRLAAHDRNGLAVSNWASRILLIDDAEIEFLTLQRMLQKIPGQQATLDWVSQFHDAITALDREQHDLYLVDVRLGHHNGLDLIRYARSRGNIKPIIVLTGHGNPIVDEAATDAGANDYLVKGEFDAVLLERAIRYAIRDAQALAKLDQRLAECQMTARKMAVQSERRAAAEADLLQVLRQTMTDQEAERKRIARELHDNLGQLVTLVQFGLDALERSEASAAERSDRISSLKRTANDLSTSLHRIAWEVRPTALDSQGLEDAITQLVTSWEPHCGLVFDLHLGIGERRLPPDVEIALYRIVQEGITNVVRHAEATRVGIILERRPTDVICIVEDDGCGLVAAASDQQSPRRLGLVGMRERLTSLGGSVELESDSGRGTALFARVPLATAKDAE